jgi:hypothetical protein
MIYVLLFFIGAALGFGMSYQNLVPDWIAFTIVVMCIAAAFTWMVVEDRMAKHQAQYLKRRR